MSLCDVCVHKLTLAPTQGAISLWTLFTVDTDYENFRELPDSLKSDALKNTDLIQIVNSRLSIVRNTPRGRIFPTFLINPELKDEFTRDLEQDQDTVKRILYDVPSAMDRRNITLKLWAECGQHLVAVGY